MRRAFLIGVLVTTLGWAKDVETVSSVELPRYLGLWNEIYRIPNGFQDNSSKTKSVCFNTTAEYALVEDDQISVSNTCTREIEGQVVSDVAKAVGVVVDKKTNAKLTVNFTGLGVLRWLGIGNGDYWILGLGPVNGDGKYAWALVGNPNRKYGWILSRNPTLPESELAKIFAIAEANGYTRAQFVTTQRPTAK